ncbi:MAG: DoxX family protein [Calditrichaeota bacterium]|nr:DoxX family protein [Calditrichota bacterium]
MKKVVWALQIILALLFLAFGSGKLMNDKAAMIESGGAWAEDFTETELKIIGGLEILGAIGLIVPAATGIMAILTPLAACGLALTMIGAAATHINRGEMEWLPVNIVIFLLAAFVAWKKFTETKVPVPTAAAASPAPKTESAPPKKEEAKPSSSTNDDDTHMDLDSAFPE